MMFTKKRYITPLLAVGRNAVPADRAIKAIEAGHEVTVKDDKTAETVLWFLGVDDEVIADRIHFSHTGQTLVQG
jgi:hypothetical protein